MEHFGQISLSEEQAELMDLADKFCRKRSPIDKVRKVTNGEKGYDGALWADIIELGWLGIAVPGDFGGVGVSLAEVAPVMEALGRVMTPGPFFSTTLAAQAILTCGHEAQKLEMLPAIVGGAVATLALAEPEGDWDLKKVNTTANHDGDGFRLEGIKNLVCDAMASRWIVVSAMLEG